MALTKLQRDVCRLIADNRLASGESYVAGGAALNELIGAPRQSRDVDLFHDSDSALAASWNADRDLLASHGYAVELLRERAGIVEAVVSDRHEQLRMDWARDSAFRFFPLVRHPDFGLVLHPFDLATNKVLALVGRLEVRDWVDIIESDERLQPLGYLAWAACGKDPGFSPSSLLEHAARSSHYSLEEVRQLDFGGQQPDPGELSRRWHVLLSQARSVIDHLPAEHIGTCVLDATAELCRARAEELPSLLAGERGGLRFHRGRILGALPTTRPA